MTKMKEIIDKLKNFSDEQEYDVYPPGRFNVELYDYNFGRLINIAPRDFWTQYKEFVELADGFHIDGYYIYGIDNHDCYENDLFSYNNALRELFECEILFEEEQYIIHIGSSSLDNFMYDVRTHKWESRDRFQYDNLFISCDSLADFLAAIYSDIRG